MYTDKYTASDAIKVSLSQFNVDDDDINYQCTNNQYTISLNKNDNYKLSWIIAMISIDVDMGEHVQFKQDGKTVTLNRVNKT